MVRVEMGSKKQNSKKYVENKVDIVDVLNESLEDKVLEMVSTEKKIIINSKEGKMADEVKSNNKETSFFFDDTFLEDVSGGNVSDNNGDNSVSSKDDSVMGDLFSDDVLNAIDAALSADISEKNGVESTHGGSLDFAIIGLGQAGGRIAEVFYKAGYKKTLVINTATHDLVSLKEIPEEHKLKLGDTDGAGKNMAVSARIFKNNVTEVLQKMREIIGNNIDGIIVCAGAGGGTGCGMLIPCLDLCNKYMKSIGVVEADKRVGAFVAIPSNGELSSPLVKSNTITVMKKLSEFADAGHISPLIIIDNEKARRLFSKVPVTKFYPFINNFVVNIFHVFNKVSKHHSDIVSFDKADYSSIIFSSGHMVFGMTTISEKYVTDSTLLSKAFRLNIEQNLLASGFDLTTAKVVGTIVIGEKRIMDTVPGLMDALEDAFTMISHLTGDSTVHRGIYTDPTVKGLRLLTIVGGLKAPEEKYMIIEKI